MIRHRIQSSYADVEEQRKFRLFLRKTVRTIRDVMLYETIAFSPEVRAAMIRAVVRQSRRGIGHGVRGAPPHPIPLETVYHSVGWSFAQRLWDSDHPTLDATTRELLLLQSDLRRLGWDVAAIQNLRQRILRTED